MTVNRTARGRNITVTFGWPFMIAAALILIFGMGIVWWQAILVTILAAFRFTLTFTTR